MLNHLLVGEIYLPSKGGQCLYNVHSKQKTKVMREKLSTVKIVKNVFFFHSLFSLQLRKNQQNRMNQKALKRVEKEKCKHSQARKEGFSTPGGLVFTNEHYGVPGYLNRPSAPTDSIEHTERLQATADAENGSIEPRPSVGNGSISQVGDNSIDELLSYNRMTESGSAEECANNLHEGSDRIIARVNEESEGSLDKHSSTFVANSSLIGEYVSIVQENRDSLKDSDYCAEYGGSSEQKDESKKIETIDFHREGSLAGCETCEPNEPSSTDDSRGKALAASASGDEDEGVEHNLRVSELVNCLNKTSTFGDESSIENEAIKHASSENQHAGAEEGMAAQERDEESHVETKILDTASSNVVTLSAQGETPSDKNCTENLARPVTGPEDSTEIHQNFRPRSVLVDKWTEGRRMSCICLPVEIHQCEYTTISSPRVLKVVLKAYSSHRANEEEVGEANKFSRICLSGWHLKCENGSWIVVDQANSRSVCDSHSAVKIQLSERLDAFFHKEERIWTVIENVHVANESDDVKNHIQNQDVTDVFARTENLSNVVAPQDQSVTSDLSPCNAHQDLNVTFSGDKAQDVAKTSFETRRPPVGSSTVFPNPRADSPNQRALHSAIQHISEKVITFRRSAKDGFGDTKYGTFVETICNFLCSALWDVLSVGLRKRFFGKYTVWNVVEEFKDVLSHVRQTVDWVNTKYALLGETLKFQAFVCECLNIGNGTLHQWLESVFRQSKKKLNKYYRQDGIVFHLSRENLEELVSDLSRISSLRFELNFESWIRTQGYDPNKAAFAFE